MADTSTRLANALTAWERVLGATRVQVDDTSAYRASTTGTQRRIAAVLRPPGVDEIQQIVEVAREHRIPIYPISTGHNWGYGSANPVRDDTVIVDLGDMDAIRDFDPELGTVTVEPGVTQQQLRDFLDQRQAPYLVPVTGAGPHCSLLGNALERGYGITPYTDHFGAVTWLQAVLPDGALYNGALTEIGGQRVDGLFKWGIGPYLDGLFAQGNMGIVTQATLALAPRPERVTAFFFGVADDGQLDALIPAMRQVLREFPGQVPAMNLLNEQRMLSMLGPFPAEEARDGVLPAEVVERLARHHRIDRWNGVGAIYAEPGVARAVRRRLRRILGPHTRRLIFVSDVGVRRVRRIADALPRGLAPGLRGMLDKVSATLDIMTGRPSEVALPLAYWRSGRRAGNGSALDPARDGCGLIWYAPLVPFTAEAVRGYIKDLETICPAYGLNPLVTLTTLNDRCFDSTVPLLFDRQDPRAVERARAGYRALLDAGRRSGNLPYRVNTDGMDFIHSHAPVASQLATRLKSAVDPDHIIAPGRYVPLDDPENPAAMENAQ